MWNLNGVAFICIYNISSNIRLTKKVKLTPETCTKFLYCTDFHYLSYYFHYLKLMELFPVWDYCG